MFIRDSNHNGIVQRTQVANAKHFILWDGVAAIKMRCADNELNLRINTQFLMDFAVDCLLKRLALIDTSSHTLPCTSLGITMGSTFQEQILVRLAIPDECGY